MDFIYSQVPFPLMITVVFRSLKRPSRGWALTPPPPAYRLLTRVSCVINATLLVFDADMGARRAAACQLRRR